MKQVTFILMFLLLASGIIQTGFVDAAESNPTDLSELSDAELDVLEAAVVQAEDVEAIKRLTHIFGYYRDNFLQEEMLALFSEDAVVDYAGGQYLGKTSIRRLFGSDTYKPASIVGSTGPQAGVLNDHILMQHVITLADNGLTANGRFKDWNMQAEAGVSAVISTGTYENQYVKENDIWKISAMAYCTRYERPYYSGLRELQENPRSFRVPTFYPEDPDGPDKQSNVACHVYPDVGINPPFHYPHAVTGEIIQKP